MRTGAPAFGLIRLGVPSAGAAALRSPPRADTFTP